MSKYHDFTHTLTTGLEVRVYVEEHDRRNWTISVECEKVKRQLEIPEADIDEINFRAEQAIESAFHAKDDSLYEQWKDRKLGDA